MQPPAKPTYEDGVRLQREKRWAEAAAAYRAAAGRVVEVRLAANLGVCLYELGEFAEAERWLLLAARQWTGNADLRQRLGALYSGQGRVELAELEYRTALAFDPGHLPAQLSLGALLVGEGRFAEGWPLFEARVTMHERVVPKVQLPYPEWQGEPLAGKAVFVQVEQGLGDQIQMCRFAGELKARGASRVTLACRPPLADLLLTAPGVDATVPLGAGQVAAVGRHDYWTRYFTLPWRLGTTLETLPKAPYLSAPADRLARWRPKARIGLAWQANPEGFNGSIKSLPPDLAQRILDLGAMSLHPEDTGAADMADTAAIVAGLDLVVSIDTSVAHLAGAMGKPTWTLLPYLKTDWRWMRGRTDSPWYPSMRLFRQAQPWDWAPTVDEICAELARR